MSQLPMEPQPTVGDIIQGAGQATTPTQSSGPGFMDRVEGFLQAFEKPEVQTFLLQAGLRLMQPIPHGQTALGHLGTAIGEGATAITATRKAAADESARQRQLSVQERQATVQERRATTDEQAEARQARQGDRRLDLTDEEIKTTRDLRLREMDLRRELAQETNDIRRAEIIKDLNVSQKQVEAAQLRLDRQLEARAAITDANLRAKIAGEIMALIPFMSENVTVENIITNTQKVLRGLETNQQSIQMFFPKTVQEIPEDKWATLLADPRQVLSLLQIYRDEASKAFILKKLAETTAMKAGEKK